GIDEIGNALASRLPALFMLPGRCLWAGALAQLVLLCQELGDCLRQLRFHEWSLTDCGFADQGFFRSMFLAAGAIGNKSIVHGMIMGGVVAVVVVVTMRAVAAGRWHRGPVLALPRTWDIEHLAILGDGAPGHGITDLAQLEDQVLVGKRVRLIFVVD